MWRSSFSVEWVKYCILREIYILSKEAASLSFWKRVYSTTKKELHFGAKNLFPLIVNSFLVEQTPFSVGVYCFWKQTGNHNCYLPCENWQKSTRCVSCPLKYTLFCHLFKYGGSNENNQHIWASALQDDLCDQPSRKHAYAILTPLNPSFI